MTICFLNRFFSTKSNKTIFHCGKNLHWIRFYFLCKILTLKITANCNYNFFWWIILRNEFWQQSSKLNLNHSIKTKIDCVKQKRKTFLLQLIFKYFHLIYSNLIKKVDHHWYEEDRKEHLPCLAILTLHESTKLEQETTFFLTG